MAEELSLKVKLETQVQELEKQKESLITQGAFKDAPKKLQQIELWIKELKGLINSLDPSSNSQLNSTRALFSRIISDLVQAGLKLKDISKELQDLYKERDRLEGAKESRRTTLDTQRGRLDSSGRLRNDDPEARQWIANKNIVYANKKSARGVEALRKNVESVNANGGDWKGTFASEADYKKAKEVYERILREESGLSESIKQLDREIKDITAKIEKINAEISTKESATEIPAEVSALTDIKTNVGTEIGKQKEANVQSEIEENTRKNTEATNEFTGALNKQSSPLGKAFKQFTLYAVALRTVKKALHEAVGTIKNLDKYLTEQAMVTGKTRKETYGLLKDYQRMASSLGATTKEVAEVATQFMRQGKTTADALTLTTAAISAAKVAGISATESVNYLTTALNGFQLSAQQAMDVSDKFAAIAAQSATSYEEIATALSKVAAQANLAGMSIDYTTALLAKGIETTREAPETIGTALKTVIARMRELGDYGETLEDGMDINNVETQLAYVDIKLRDTNGELRSTEDVLDELGKKWDTLNSNQQAAIAKALAGTRQQSRLIAMMNDYERVTELQEIAQRSQGATAAQAAVYMEGMEASLNKVSVAWEKIVTTVTNSDVIIDLIDRVSVALDNLANFLSATAGMVTTMVLLSTIGLVILGNKMKEHQINTQIRKIQILQGIQEAKNRVQEQKTAVIKAQQVVLELKRTKAIAQATMASETATEAEKAQAQAILSTIDAEISAAEQRVTIEEGTLSIYEQQEKSAESQISWISQMGSGLMGLTAPLFIIISLWKTISGLITIVRTKQAAAHKKNMAEAIAENSVNATSAAGKIISNLGVWGIPIAVAVAAALAGITLAIGAGITSSTKSAGDQATSDINKLSNEIYKLTERANAIKTIEDQFDALDKKIIKTTGDQQKLNELFDSAGDKLSEEKKKDDKGKDIDGTSEKELYAAIETDQEKYIYLQNVENEARKKANDLRQKQLDILKNLNPALRQEMLTNKDNAEYLKVQSAVRAINNNTLYEYIDSLKDAGKETEAFAQSILNELDAEQQYQYAIESDQHSIKNLVDTIDNATTIINGEKIRWTDVLSSDDYTFKERINAFKELEETVKSLNDPELLKAFQNAYQEWNNLAGTMSDVSLAFMDRVGMTIDRLNDWGLTLQKFGLTTEQAVDKINALLGMVSGGTGVGDAIKAVFESELRQFEEGTEEWTAAYDKLLNAYQSAVNVTILNLGQSMEALHNRVNNIYEQAQKWNELSDTEKTTFMNDNADLFSGEDGARLYEAFQTQNYNLIQQALEHNKVLQDTIEKRKEELELLLDIEEARDDDSRNEGQIAYLKEQIRLLNETKDIYRASLKLRLEQEQAQLDIYKEFLNKQQSALEESLNKRKNAYSKYFETINQEAEDEEYEEKANLLITNLAKLAGSDDAATKLQAAELEAELKQLEADRLRELRERAQEAVLNNIDDQLTDIADKFDKLLENNQLLLQAMTAQITGDPTGFVSSTLSSGIQNLTALGAENFLQEFRTTFGSILPSSALDNINITESSSGDTLILNVAGKEIEIGDSTQQELYLAIMKAMRQLGIK